MNKSDEIGQLALALSKLQGEIKDAVRDRKAYSYNYADLSQVLEISRPLLAKHRLSVPQLCSNAHDRVTVETVLMHESGQWISSVIEMGVERGKGMSTAQAVGAVISYARRYSLCAILGISQVDNDGVVVEPVPVKALEEYIKSSTLSSLKDLINEHQITCETVDSWTKKANVEEISELSEKIGQALIGHIKKTYVSAEGQMS